MIAVSTRVALAAALCLFTIVGCGSGSNDRESGKSPASRSPSPSPTAVYIAGNPEPQKVGQPFVFDLEDEVEGPSAQLTITVKKVTCGIKGWDIPLDETTGEPGYRMSAPAGTRFCRVDLAVTNTGKQQVQFTPGGEMYDTDDNEFVYDQDATDAVGNAEQVDVFGGNTVELRPAERGRSVVVFPINIGSAPAYVRLNGDGVSENINGELLFAQVDIAAKDVAWRTPRGE